MIRIGLIGEDPYDKSSIQNLLKRRYQHVHFKPLLQGVRGKALDSPKTARALAQELKDHDLHFVVFIRDLDGFYSEKHLVSKVESWFASLRRDVDILLLNVWELEALIFADIDTFNKEYGVNIRSGRDPMMIKDPKEELKKHTRSSKRRYNESDCTRLFSLLDLDRIELTCKSFQSFIQEFESRLNVHNG